jgi:carboxymethylenebutenolidase
MGVSHTNSVSRRGIMSRMAVAAAAGMVAPALTPVAHAVGSDDGLKTFKGRYALRGGRIVDGYFVAPGKAFNLDVVVVLHGENGFDAAARALAHDHARAGKLAIVPDMPATYRGIAALAGRDAHVADIRAMRDAFGRHVRGNGKVEFVSA